jgi:hypothetical protein
VFEVFPQVIQTTFGGGPQAFELVDEVLVFGEDDDPGLAGRLEDFAVLSAVKAEVAHREGINSQMRPDPRSQMRRELGVYPEDQAASTG